MKEKILELARPLIAPRERSATLSFQNDLADERSKIKAVYATDWRDAATVIAAYIEVRIAIVNEAIRRSVQALNASVSADELNAIFNSLRPTLEDLRSFVFEAIRGLGIPGIGTIVYAVENTYALSSDLARAELSVLAVEASQSGRTSAIFVSCGQVTDSEKTLGKAIVSLIDRLTPYDGYFAENQQSLEGVTTNILGKMATCRGFVGVLHDRGSVSTPVDRFVRGSVWIEQEIAIASFREQILKQHVEVVTYVKHGIKLEGLRSALLLNSIPFDDDSEIVKDFEERLKAGAFA